MRGCRLIQSPQVVAKERADLPEIRDSAGAMIEIGLMFIIFYPLA